MHRKRLQLCKLDLSRPELEIARCEVGIHPDDLDEIEEQLVIYSKEDGRSFTIIGESTIPVEFSVLKRDHPMSSIWFFKVNDSIRFTITNIIRLVLSLILITNGLLCLKFVQTMIVMKTRCIVILYIINLHNY